MNQLNQVQKSRLRRQAYQLKPIVMIGNKGLTEAVQLELNQALTDHELVKIKISGYDKDSRETMTQSILDVQKAQLIQQVGHVIVVYRKSNKQQKVKKS